MISIKVPTIGESISEVTLAKWLKPDGAWVERDEVICELESEKATFELNAEQAGVLKIKAQEGDTLHIGDVACEIDETAERPAEAVAPNLVEKASTPAPTVASDVKTTPLAHNIIEAQNLDAHKIQGTGSLGRITKSDVLSSMQKPGTLPATTLFSRQEKREKMSNLRKTISRRLVEAKNATAMLTTFNEVDMSAIMSLRTKYKDAFKEKHQVGLGFMSFFTKAVCIALQEWKAVNAYIDGDEIVYHDYCDVSIAVSAPKGLVVPVIRNAESLSMAEIEKAVSGLAKNAKENKLTIEEMTGGTFTITNGGVFGSLLSTPIINIPQSAILGMHKIQERPIAVNGQVEIRPMMYVALSYDHRIIDGRESVGFLVRVKELLENPTMLLAAQDPAKLLLEL
ncbi:MAG: 2-oxoglutarate dehydrogenase complex dihydrolipoyllysine-residue succinyltransferase [Chitinophagales bacterium]|nr:MAG: 2-oxoglutarate dehydrogenase, E2 subunit, dihydrolipoamide succinyltransferase [Bacteroidetes bacterium OLB11]MCC6517001.1 2-oxoglutarate dehydrogenase complex dihydrolipoyllysine-residue succinyltransferase [Chitinophagales bacterium]